MIASHENLAGRRFGRLSVLEEVACEDRRRRWSTRCECGASKLVRATDLLNGRISSCGCFRRESARATLTTHGRSRTKLHRIWSGMIARCTIPSATGYCYYGARGITVCERWLASFENFAADMGEPPPGLTLDREKNDEDYSPGNCRWATRSEQSKNRRPWGTAK